MAIKYHDKLERLIGENKTTGILVKNSKVKELLDLKDELRKAARRRAGILRDGMGHI